MTRPETEPGPEHLGAVLARVAQQLRAAHYDHDRDVRCRDDKEPPAMAAPSYHDLPLPQRFRILADAARAAIDAKPWAADHFRTCARFWDRAAQRAEQQNGTGKDEVRS